MKIVFVNKEYQTLSVMNSNIMAEKPWAEVNIIIDYVYKNFCGQATFNDFKLLLERKILWSNKIQQYVTQMLNK